MAADVSAVQESVDTHCDRVREVEGAVAEGAHERPVGLEDYDGMVGAARAIAAREQIDAVVGSGGDARHVAEGPPLWELGPPFDLLKDSPARSLYSRRNHTHVH